MDDDDRLLAAHQSRDALLQVPQRVAVLREQHQLLPRGSSVSRWSGQGSARQHLTVHTSALVLIPTRAGLFEGRISPRHPNSRMPPCARPITTRLCPAVWQFGPPRTPTSCFPAASSTCIHLSDQRQRRHIAPSLHLVNPRYSITVRRVVQPPNNAVHNVLRSPIGDHDGRHRLLRHGYHSDAFSGLLCLGQFGNQPPLPFILPRSAFAGHEPIGVLLVHDARPQNERRSICIRHLPDYRRAAKVPYPVVHVVADNNAPAIVRVVRPHLHIVIPGRERCDPVPLRQLIAHQFSTIGYRMLPAIPFDIISRNRRCRKQLGQGRSVVSIDVLATRLVVNERC